MMATSRNRVAAVMVASLLFAFGCGDPMMPDADTGPDPMTDAGPNPMTDSGIDPEEDAGNGMDSGPDPMMCVPSQADPLCEMAPPGAECECDMSFVCDTAPDHCIGALGANSCEPGVYNRCGYHLPMSMDTYRYDEWRHDCTPNIDDDRWDYPGGNVRVRTEWHNGQLWMIFQNGNSYICGNEGKCWRNWANADSQEHSVIEFAPDGCEFMREFHYRAGDSEHYDETVYVLAR